MRLFRILGLLTAFVLSSGVVYGQDGAAMAPLISNDAVLLGVLILILAWVFTTSHSEKPRWKNFYKFVPALLLCYFLPSLLTAIPSGLNRLFEDVLEIETRIPPLINAEESSLYFVASRFLLPASLVLLTLSIDLKGIVRLGPKAGAMFLTGTIGIMIGGPIAILIVSWISPETVGGEGPDAVWRGLSTVAGSWIGGGANQAAMKEVWDVGDKIFSAMIAVDVIVANVWMAFLLYGAGKSRQIDDRSGADTEAIDELQEKMEDYQKKHAKNPSLTELMTLMGIAFGVTAGAHFLADIVAPFLQKNAPGLADFGLHSQFFWLIIFATTGGVALSFTKYRRYEGMGASKFGSLFLYVLVATIGMKMDIFAIFDNLGLFAVGFLWMGIHAGLMLLVGRLIKAPFFFIAVGSQANVGGAASAPIVASAFHPALAPVGVLLAVLGYALGTYGALACAIMMQGVAP